MNWPLCTSLLLTVACRWLSWVGDCQDMLYGTEEYTKGGWNTIQGLFSIMFKFLNTNWASFELWYEQLIKLKKNITIFFSLLVWCVYSLTRVDLDSHKRSVG